MMQEDPDLALVQDLQAGKDRALNSLMDRHREGLFRFVLRQVRNEAEALELTMETFVRAYLRSRAYQYSLQTTSFGAPVEEGGDPSLLLAAGGRPDQRADRREELIA